MPETWFQVSERSRPPLWLWQPRGKQSADNLTYIAFRTSSRSPSARLVFLISLYDPYHSECALSFIYIHADRTKTELSSWESALPSSLPVETATEKASVVVTNALLPAPVERPIECRLLGCPTTLAGRSVQFCSVPCLLDTPGIILGADLLLLSLFGVRAPSMALSYEQG